MHRKRVTSVLLVAFSVFAALAAPTAAASEAAEVSVSVGQIEETIGESYGAGDEEEWMPGDDATGPANAGRAKAQGSEFGNASSSEAGGNSSTGPSGTSEADSSEWAQEVDPDTGVTLDEQDKAAPTPPTALSLADCKAKVPVKPGKVRTWYRDRWSFCMSSTILGLQVDPDPFDGNPKDGALSVDSYLVGFGRSGSNFFRVNTYLTNWQTSGTLSSGLFTLCLDFNNVPTGYYFAPDYLPHSSGPQCQTLDTASKPSQADPFVERVRNFADNSPDLAAGTVTKQDVNYRVLIQSSTGDGSGSAESPTFDLRCDYTPRSGFWYSEKACLFPDAIPTLKLSKTDSDVDESALHIYTALTDPASTLPTKPGKSIPSVLHRTRSTAVRDTNRNRAAYTCLTQLGTRPTGDQCDEYPFATTREGAAQTVNGTFTDNFSVRWIDADDNREAGARLNETYAFDRIMNGEGVKVVIEG